MLCKHVYTAEDEPVKAGRRKVGEVCNSTHGSERYGGYCAPHAKQHRTIPQEEWDEENKKRSEAKRSKRLEHMENVAATINGKDSETPYVNKNVLDAMNLNEPCDLKTEYAIFCATNPNPTFVKYNEKMAFARWIRTPAHLRTPQTTEEAADILGITSKTLNCWRTSPDVIRFINEDTENRFLGLYPFAMYKLGCRIDNGDVQGIKLYKEWYEEKMARANKKEVRLDIPEDLQKEAAEHAAETGKINRGQSLASEKNMVVDSYFAGKLPSEDEQ